MKGESFSLEQIMGIIFAIMVLIAIVFLIYQWHTKGIGLVDYFARVFR